MRKTKIVFTIGPSTENEEILRQIVPNIDIVRFNFSHNKKEWHKENLQKVRKIQKEIGGKAIATVADLQGPKIRIGEMGDSIQLKESELLYFTPFVELHNPEKKIFYVDYPKIHEQLSPGNQILLDNGLSAELVVTEVKNEMVEAKVIFGGILKGRKTVNLPGVLVDLPVLTEKDLEDLDFVLNLDFDFVALSFVRSVEDVLWLKRILKEKKREDIKIMVKIEDQYGVKNFEEIINEADASIIARGDMGAEMRLEEIPSIQEDLIKISRYNGKPSIVATQMLESMVEKPMPTRAEVTDVANAVWQKCDAVWLSEESSVGKYPKRAVEWLVRIINETEKGIVYESPKIYELKNKLGKNVMVAGASEIAEMIGAKKIVAMTETGTTANLVSSMRPSTEIIAFCPNRRVENQLALSWGVFPISIEFGDSPDEAYQNALKEIKNRNIMADGEKFVLVSDAILGGERSLSIQIREFQI